jgi:hypothetical protein
MVSAREVPVAAAVAVLPVSSIALLTRLCMHLPTFLQYKIVTLYSCTCLIIGAWNYPVLLIFKPLVGAIAAGNTAVRPH